MVLNTLFIESKRVISGRFIAAKPHYMIVRNYNYCIDEFKSYPNIWQETCAEKYFLKFLFIGPNFMRKGVSQPILIFSWFVGLTRTFRILKFNYIELDNSVVQPVWKPHQVQKTWIDGATSPWYTIRECAAIYWLEVHKLTGMCSHYVQKPGHKSVRGWGCKVGSLKRDNITRFTNVLGQLAILISPLNSDSKKWFLNLLSNQVRSPDLVWQKIQEQLTQGSLGSKGLIVSEI